MDLIYLRITHGIGAGLIVKGHLVTGAHGFAGEVGHLRIGPSGPLCPRCGARGCLEASASERAIKRELGVVFGVADPDMLDLNELLQSPSSHPAVKHAIWEAGWNVGSALAQTANLLDPEWVVLGG